MQLIYVYLIICIFRREKINLQDVCTETRTERVQVGYFFHIDIMKMICYLHCLKNVKLSEHEHVIYRIEHPLNNRLFSSICFMKNATTNLKFFKCIRHVLFKYM